MRTGLGSSSKSIDNKTKLGMSFFLYNYLQGWLNCTLYNAMTFTWFLSFLFTHSMHNFKIFIYRYCISLTFRLTR